MFIGHYQLGDLVPVSVWTRNGSGTPTVPDDAPLVTVYDADGNADDARLIPIVDKDHITGWFSYRINLDSDFATGYYTVMVNYVIGGTSYADVSTFEILPGGDAEGVGIAMHMFKQPAADYVLLQTDQGRLKRLRNPSLRGSV